MSKPPSDAYKQQSLLMNGNGTGPAVQLLHMALVAARQSRWNEVATLCEQVLSLDPERMDAGNLLVHALQRSGEPGKAIRACERIMQITGPGADMLNNLGTLYELSGNMPEALARYRKATGHDRNHFQANYNLGRCSAASGDLRTAIDALGNALKTDDRSVPVLQELALAYKRAGDLENALKYGNRARGLSPEIPQTLNLLGSIYYQLGNIGTALQHYQQAIEISPDYADAWNNIGSALLARGNINAAMQSYRKAIELRPDWEAARSNCLLTSNYTDCEQQEILALHCEWGTRLESLHGQRASHPVARKKTISIGYVSPDFRAHSVAWFLLAILRNHDHDRFHITCFSDTTRPDEVTDELRACVDEWVNIAGLSSTAAIAEISARSIDILVDLAGHTAHNRLDVFAEKPVPVQASYLGYPNTTGLRSIDFRITDSLADPPGEADQLHTESLVRLPGSFLCYTPLADAPPCAPPPCVKQQDITFGSFNVLAKLSDPCINAWSAILTGTDNSKLLLKSAGLDDPGTRDYILKRFGSAGIDSDRITLLARTGSFRDHLALYNRVDISLDTFPYNGTTTTCESLWMGVPVITLAGDRHASRVGASLLTVLGLQEFIASSTANYVSIAATLACNREALRDLRGQLRDRMASSPLCDGAGFTRNLEAAYRTMLDTSG